VSLANDYRPSSFDDVVEQDVVVNILKNICSKELQNRNFLLIGSQGIGKTTLARIMNTALNDGACEPIELDGASNNGIDDIRSIIEDARQYPIHGKYKVFIIDECQALSSAAWGSALKLLEESPARSVFILCTTNPEKIPKTIISRVQVFRLSKISTKGIYDRLHHVVQSEIEKGRDIIYEPHGLVYIAKMANGGMRDALTLLDKCLAYSNEISSDSVVKALGLPSFDDYFNLLGYMSKRNIEGMIQLIDDVYNSGVNFVTWFEGFNSFLANVIKYCFMRDITKTSIPASYCEKMAKYTEAHAKVCMIHASAVSKLIPELRRTSYQQETAVIYLCDCIRRESK
jgi:DNA polymerase-3 subunit gamma/tau